MAKLTPTRRSVVPQPEYSPGYTWMLLFAVLAMAGGAALHYLELTSDYNFETEPKGAPAIPKLTPLTPRDTPAPKGNQTRAPIAPPDDRAEVTPEPPLGEQPVRTRAVGPTLFHLPPPLPLPGIHTR